MKCVSNRYEVKCDGTMELSSVNYTCNKCHTILTNCDIPTLNLNAIDLDIADKLVKETDYAIEATHQDINPINWGDASAFFIEGYNYAVKLINKKPNEKKND